MQVEHDLGHEILARVRRRGATEADVLVSETESFTTQVRLREIEALKGAQERRLHLRELGLRHCLRGPDGAVDDPPLPAQSDVPDPAALDDLAERATLLLPLLRILHIGFLRHGGWPSSLLHFPCSDKAPRGAGDVRDDGRAPAHGR